MGGKRGKGERSRTVTSVFGSGLVRWWGLVVVALASALGYALFRSNLPGVEGSFLTEARAAIEGLATLTARGDEALNQATQMLLGLGIVLSLSGMWKSTAGDNRLVFSAAINIGILVTAIEAAAAISTAIVDPGASGSSVIVVLLCWAAGSAGLAFAYVVPANRRVAVAKAEWKRTRKIAKNAGFRKATDVGRNYAWRTLIARLGMLTTGWVFAGLVVVLLAYPQAAEPVLLLFAVALGMIWSLLSWWATSSLALKYRRALRAIGTAYGLFASLVFALVLLSKMPLLSLILATCAIVQFVLLNMSGLDLRAGWRRELVEYSTLRAKRVQRLRFRTVRAEAK